MEELVDVQGVGLKSEFERRLACSRRKFYPWGEKGT